MRSYIVRYCVLSAVVTKLAKLFALIRDSPMLVTAGPLLHKSLAFLESLTAQEECVVAGVLCVGGGCCVWSVSPSWTGCGCSESAACV